MSIEVAFSQAEGKTDDRFRIDSTRALAWFGSKLGAKKAAIQALDAQYAAMRAELVREEADFEGRFMVEAEDFVRDHCERTGDRSLKTLGGLFGFRVCRGGPRVEDRDAATAWAKDHLPEAVETVVSDKLDLDAVKRHMLATGETPPGASFSADEDRFYFRPPTAKGGDDGGPGRE